MQSRMGDVKQHQFHQIGQLYPKGRNSFPLLKCTLSGYAFVIRVHQTSAGNTGWEYSECLLISSVLHIIFNLYTYKTEE
jgi:hypothetical protein